MRKYLPKSFEMEELTAWYMRYISPLALIGGVFPDHPILLTPGGGWVDHPRTPYHLFPLFDARA